MLMIGIVTCSTDLAIKLWDTQNDYKNVRTLHGHDHSISTVRFTPDGERLISASRDKTIRIWEVVSGCVSLLSCLIRFLFLFFFVPLYLCLPLPFLLSHRPRYPNTWSKQLTDQILRQDVYWSCGMGPRGGSIRRWPLASERIK